MAGAALVAGGASVSGKGVVSTSEEGMVKREARVGFALAGNLPLSLFALKGGWQPFTGRGLGAKDAPLTSH